MTNTTDVSEWKKPQQGTPLELPSGNTCLVRRKPMDSFLRRGVIPNGLIPIVRQAIKGAGDDVLEALSEDLDEQKIVDMLGLFDSIVIDCVVQPKVHPIPKDEDGNEVPYDERDQSLLYVDDVDMDDKMFVYQFVVGGTRDLEQFRQQQAGNVERLRRSDDVG